QLVKIRAAVETALAKPLSAPKPPAPVTSVATPVAAASVTQVAKAAAASMPAVAPVTPSAPQVIAPNPVAQPAPQVAASAVPAAQVSANSAVEECISQIHVAVSTMSTKSAAMCSFVLKGTKVILASWEVTAFQKPNSPAAIPVQHAVASRILLIQAVEARKRGEAVN